MNSVFDGVSIAHDFADLPAQFYTALTGQPLLNARLLHVNAALATELGLNPDILRHPDFLDVVSGQAELVPGKTVAAVYSGHQFGVWAGQLGDGRAHLLGQINTPLGPQELQLKGAGKTPYSRMGDGRAVLRSSVREYLASEAMHGLGIATSRALALVSSDTPVYRETIETGAIVTRVAPTFIRFGSFEHWSSDPASLKVLFDYVVDRFYPECRQQQGRKDDIQAVADAFLDRVTQRTAQMVADWQTVGFCHGVMNTDNMSILGLTIDYGPFGFMDAFQANHICNHSDSQGRYAWNVQPSVAHWNLYRLASALMGLGLDADRLRSVLDQYEAYFLNRYYDNIRAKFGLAQWVDQDVAMLDEWWRLLHQNQADFTLSFRRLAAAPHDPESFLALFRDKQMAQQWLLSYGSRLALDATPPAERIAAMNAVNPLYVLRNHLAEQAIHAAQNGDSTEIETLFMLLQDPYTERASHDQYAAEAPEWARTLTVSCSS